MQNTENTRTRTTFAVQITIQQYVSRAKMSQCVTASLSEQGMRVFCERTNFTKNILMSLFQ